MNGESYQRGFEYDEDMEASDESFEADEADEADESDEADEAFEADESDEADEADEAWEASDEGSDEADEGSDEADEAFEADEASDEAAMTTRSSARWRVDRDRNRRAAYARRIAADRRVEAKRAASTQRNIASQIRSVKAISKAGAQAKVKTVGSLQGAGLVTAMLPNGRRSRMRIIPTMAPISEVNRLRSVVAVNTRRQAVATARNSRAISALASAQAAAVKRISAHQLKSDRELGKRLVEGHNKLDQRITKELGAGSGSLGVHGSKMMRMLRRQRQRSIMNSVLLATAAPFFAAYGERTNPFGTRNLILTGSLLGYMVGDELLDSFAGSSKGARGLATAWSYAAPVANGATAFFAFRNRQHERFISGVVSVTNPGGTQKSIDISDEVASSSVKDFQTGTRNVVVTMLGGKAGTTVEAKVDGGFLKLTFADAGTGEHKVAYVVDTQKPE